MIVADYRTKHEENEFLTKSYEINSPLGFKRILKNLINDNFKIIQDSECEIVYQLRKPAVNIIIDQTSVEIRGKTKEVIKAEEILYAQFTNSKVTLTRK